MNTTIGLLLLQDGLTTGFIYALLALSILLVFLVTRVLWVPAGDFLVFGALTLALLAAGSGAGHGLAMRRRLDSRPRLSSTWRAWRSGNGRTGRWSLASRSARR